MNIKLCYKITIELNTPDQVDIDGVVDFAVALMKQPFDDGILIWALDLSHESTVSWKAEKEA